MVAQEVEKVYPELVRTNSEGTKSLAYSKMSAVLVEAVKELKKEKDQEILSLKEENRELKAENEEINRRLEEIEKRLEQISVGNE